MQSFTILNAIAAPLPLADVDTDKIIPGRFLKTVKRTGLGVHLFDPLRYHEDGSERPEFVLNREPYRHAEVLIAFENFGCGSSREHATWALLDFGIRCVIAPSFGDIFAINAIKNGILTARLSHADCAALMKSPRVIVDLFKQVISAEGEAFTFSIEAVARSALTEGRDEIAQTLLYTDAIDSYEVRPSMRTVAHDRGMTKNRSSS